MSVRVILFGGSVAGQLAFVYMPELVVSSLSPAMGPSDGGTRVAVLGSAFSQVADAPFCRFRTAAANASAAETVGAN